MTVAFQGERGAYSEAAARLLVPDASPTGFITSARVFDAVAGGKAARGVVPVENSMSGSLGEVLDLLLAHAGTGVSVVGEHWLRIDQSLLALPGTPLDEITQVRSHPQALLQASDFLDAHLPRALRVPTLDTAGAARQIASEALEGVAALASSAAAELYGLEVVAKGIEGERSSFTRFFLLAPAGTRVDGADKSTLVVTPSEQAPNALFRALTTFVGRRLALYRIEPRPREGRPATYHYLVDIEGAYSTDVELLRFVAHLGEGVGESHRVAACVRSRDEFLGACLAVVMLRT
jgi:prephenate dehydratase